jgi:type VI secretion system secreted protein VgrG
MADSDTNDVRATFSVTGVSDTLYVLEFHGEESLSSLFHFRIDLAAETGSLSFSSILGKPALLTVTGEKGPRYVHGIVAAFQQRETARKFTMYHAVVVPKVWKLTQRRDCRIFQKTNDGEKNAKEIVSKILEGVLAESEFEFKLKNNQDPPEREYCVQYRESDWAFVSRLLEEEGIYYYFEHSTDKHVLKLRNDYQQHPAIESEEKVAFHPPGQGLPGEEHITRFFYEERIRTEKVTLQDFNFKKPSVNLKEGRPKDKDSLLEIYDYPGEYTSTSEGGDLAQIRLEEQKTQAQEADGDSDCVRMVPGYYFQLTDHERFGAADSDKYTITWMHHDGNKHGDLEAGAADLRIRYENSFRCMPRKIVFRPPRVTPRPLVKGTQTAIVTGPKDEEIYTDEHGRVKVHFHWDRLGKSDENSSCFIRASQLWAGQSWGAMHIPRIGQEVVVDFLEGDPDRPIITGRVYHGENTPPYTLSDEKTKSTLKSNTTTGGKGYNELRFEDNKGKEEVFLHAQRDYNQNVLGNMSTSVKGNQSVSVGGNQTIHVKGVQTVTVQGKHGQKGKHGSLKVTGDLTLESTNEIAIQCPSKLTLDVKGTSSTMTPGKMVLTSGKGATVTLNEADIFVEATTIEVAGGASAFVVSGGIFQAGGTAKADLTSTGPTTVTGTPVQLNGPGPYCGRVTELAVATITTGAALVLVGGASTPFEVTKMSDADCDAAGLPHGTLKVGEHIFVQPGAGPNSQFQNKVLRNLGIMSTTPSGMSTLNSIQGSGHNMKIVEFTGPNSFCGATNVITATPAGQPVFDGNGNPVNDPSGKQYKGTGGGSDTVLQLNPDLTLPNNKDPSNPMPNDAVQMHEMTHGAHEMNGTYDGSPVPGYTTVEDQKTISTGSPSEKDYLHDRGYGWQRTSHGLDWAPNP